MILHADIEDTVAEDKLIDIKYETKTFPRSRKIQKEMITDDELRNSVYLVIELMRWVIKRSRCQYFAF